MLRQLVPKPARRVIRAALNTASAQYRAVMLRAMLRRIRQTGTASTDTLRTIRQAWGNTGWSASVGYLEKAALLLRDTDGPVLDLGSGLTTVVAATLRPDLRIVSLEQDAGWVERMQSVCPPNVELVHAPLRDYGDFLWYDWRPASGTHWPVVLVDGPAIYVDSEAMMTAWRVGVVPRLQALGCTFGTLLLDNPAEPRGPGLLSAWRRMGVDGPVIQTAHGDYCAVLHYTTMEQTGGRT